MNKISALILLVVSGLAVANPSMQVLLATGETITLSGTSGTPNTQTDTATDPADASMTWEFQTDGEVWRIRQQESTTQFQDGVEWSSFQTLPAQDYWIEFTANAGSSPNLGNTLATCHKLAGSGAANRSIGWSRTIAGTYSGSVRVDIATDSGCSSIVATGYYGGTAFVEP